MVHLQRDFVGWIKLVPRLTYQGSLRASHWRAFMRRHLSRPLAKYLKVRLICRWWIPKPILRRSMERAGKLGLLNWLSRAWHYRRNATQCKERGWFKQLLRQWAYPYHFLSLVWRHQQHPDGIFRDERRRSIERIHWAILRWWMERTGRVRLRIYHALTGPLLELCVVCKHSRWSKPLPWQTLLGWRKLRRIQPRICGGCLQCQTRSPRLFVLLEGSRCISKLPKLLISRPMGFNRRKDL